MNNQKYHFLGSARQTMSCLVSLTAITTTTTYAVLSWVWIAFDLYT